MQEENTNQEWAMLPIDFTIKYGFTVGVVYALLLNQCSPPNYEISMSIPALAKKFGMSGRHLIRTINKLEEIQIVERISTDGGVNRYRIVPIVNARIHQQPAPSEPADFEPKDAYGQYKNVLLSATEYSELRDEFGDNKLEAYIQKVDFYCEQHAKNYSNCAATIRKWITEDNEMAKNSRNKLTDEEREGYLSLVNKWKKRPKGIGNTTISEGKLELYESVVNRWKEDNDSEEIESNEEMK